MSVLIGCCLSFLALCCNVGPLILGSMRPCGYSEDGVADLIRGDRSTARRWNTGLHLFINILSTMLLSGSNYTMQVMGSPTRNEIDMAHRKGDWLVIGLLSTRNWKRIAGKRVMPSVILVLSSIPLHLW